MSRIKIEIEVGHGSSMSQRHEVNYIVRHVNQRLSVNRCEHTRYLENICHTNIFNDRASEYMALSSVSDNGFFEHDRMSKKVLWYAGQNRSLLRRMSVHYQDKLEAGIVTLEAVPFARWDFRRCFVCLERGI